MASPQVWLAPAKINLFLHITGRRPDGLHNLQTVFQFIDLCDQLSFEVRKDGDILRSTAVSDVHEAEDLCIRAAQLLQRTAGISAGVNITLSKEIPIGGGLGGASSDAATTLHALNCLWDAGMNTEQLMHLGQSLGADIPIFIAGHAAWAEGIGEQLTPMELPQPWYLIADTGVHVSTREMFADSQLTRNSPQLTICPPEPGVLGNIFEPLVRRRYPEIDKVFDWLGEHSMPFLTGTGGCVVAPFEERESALAVQAQAPPEVSIYVAKGKNISPLREQLSTEGI